MLYNKVAHCLRFNFTLYLTMLYDNILSNGVFLSPCSLNAAITFVEKKKKKSNNNSNIQFNILYTSYTNVILADIIAGVDN